MVPSLIGTSYDLPVLLSVMLSVSGKVGTSRDFSRGNLSVESSTGNVNEWSFMSIDHRPIERSDPPIVPRRPHTPRSPPSPRAVCADRGARSRTHVRGRGRSRYPPNHLPVL